MTKRLSAARLVVMFAVGCSSTSKAVPSASATALVASGSSATSAAPANASAATASSATLGARCPEGAYLNENPPYCIALDRPGRPHPPEPDGPWMTTEIGPQAALSTSKSLSIDKAVGELRKTWGDDALKKRDHYDEKIEGARTIVRFVKIDKNDADDKEANDVLVVFVASGAYTIRCEIDGGMTSDTVCLGLSLPTGG